MANENLTNFHDFIAYDFLSGGKGNKNIIIIYRNESCLFILIQFLPNRWKKNFFSSLQKIIFQFLHMTSLTGFALTREEKCYHVKGQVLFYRNLIGYHLLHL